MLDYKSMMDTFFEKGDSELLLEEINWRDPVKVCVIDTI